jgi:hypothetical protein
MADSSKPSKAPSFYTAQADMQMSGKGGAGSPPPGGAGGAGGQSAEETKIVATLLEVYKKWDAMTTDPKRKEKIQQLAKLTEEIQSGMAGGDGKPMPAGDSAGGPTPDAGAGAMSGTAGGGGAGGGAGQPVPA